MILIVGGSGCLGQNLAEKLTKAGKDVVIADLNPPSEAAAKKYPFIQMDATDPQSIQNARQAIEDKGMQIDHVVNTIGALIEQGLTDFFNTTADEIDRTIDVNLKSQLYVVRYLGEHVAKSTADDKSFTLISSINAHQGYSIPFYSAAKGGLHSFVRPAAIRLGEDNVRINLVTPGTVFTPSTEQQPKSFEDRADAAALKRLTTVDEVTDAIMASINLTGMTGQEIVVDSGQSINPSESLFDQRRRGTAPR